MSRKSDAYEKQHMSEDGEEQVLYRDKFVAPWPFHIIMLATTLASVLPFLFVPLQWMALVIGLPLVVLWLMFSVMRVSVSTEHVHAQLGIFGPKIPIDAIQSAKAVKYDWKKFGGWGIRRSLDGQWAYNMLGDAGHAVEIVYEDTDKGTQTVLLTSGEATLLADAIAQARGLEVSMDTQDEVAFDHNSEEQDDLSEGSKEAKEANAQVSSEQPS